MTTGTMSVAVGEFIGFGGAYFNYFAYEVKLFAGKRVVEIHAYMLGFNGKHFAPEAVAFVVHHGHLFAFGNHFGIEFAFFVEESSHRDIHDVFELINSVAVFGLDAEVECITNLFTGKVTLKFGQELTYTKQKHKRILNGSLFYSGFTFAVFAGNSEVVVYGYHTVFSNNH